MLFNSWEYLVFFTIVCGLYYCSTFRLQNVLLLVASYVFYAWWDWRFTSLLLISTVVDYTASNRMPFVEEKRRKFLLLLSICTNLGILGFFKYFGFFVGSTVDLLTKLGLQVNMPVLGIVLPIGISFYTFQTMAYTIDVYRGRIRPERNVVLFAVYVAYFPQLVAGPIERAQNLLPQLRSPRKVNIDQLASGGVLILIGLMRKLVIADIAAGFVDEAFENPSSMGYKSLIKAVFYFSLQIYGDFAGYSDIARGCSRLLGIELMENFAHPYLTTSITSFWRRWHISLSTWLRDYLYLPLGGNRGPKSFFYRNIMLTMLLGGLWHGAAWNFVIWGGIHGMALVMHKVWLDARKSPQGWSIHSARGVLYALLSWFVTMMFVGLAWIFFRSPDFATSIHIIKSIVFMYSEPTQTGWLPNQPLLFLTLLMLLIDVPQKLSLDHTVFLSLPWIMRGLIYAAGVMVLVLWGSPSRVPFIYFRF